MRMLRVRTDVRTAAHVQQPRSKRFIRTFKHTVIPDPDGYPFVFFLVAERQDIPRRVNGAVRKPDEVNVFRGFARARQGAVASLQHTMVRWAKRNIAFEQHFHTHGPRGWGAALHFEQDFEAVFSDLTGTKKERGWGGS
jgi:hypothetical protein